MNHEDENIKKSPKLTRGTSRAVLLSILIHAGLFLIATVLVVFTVMPRDDQRFDPPKTAERPKMKLKKPKVHIKKTSKPKTAKIVTQSKRSPMPVIDIPGMSGLGEGFDANFEDGLALMPDMNDVSVFGGGQSIGNDLEGTFYHLIRGRNGQTIPYNHSSYFEAVNRFLKSDWDTSLLQKYYVSPRKIYSTIFMVPPTYSGVAPQAFGEYEAEGQKWLIHYKGQIVHSEDITFRFVGQADAVMAIRFNGELVFGSAWHSNWDKILGGIWNPSDPDDRKWWMGNYKANVGKWIAMKADELYNIEILLGDNNGLACLMLCVQEKGVEYEIRPGGGPRLPAFKTAMPSLDLQDMIYRDMVPGEVSLTNGPIFNDYSIGSRGHPAANMRASAYAETTDTEAPSPTAGNVQDSCRRIWTQIDAKSFEAEYVRTVGRKVVLKNRNGKQISLPLDTLSKEDLIFAELMNPPTLKVSVSSKSGTSWAVIDKTKVEVIGHDYVYSGHIKQTSAGSYDHELYAELFAIGAQRYAETYILLDRQVSTFNLTEENDRSHDFSSGRKVHVRKIEPRSWENADFTVRGEEHYGYLLLVRDQRGEIIASSATANWISDAYENFRELQIGTYVDKSGTRVFPQGPPRSNY